MLTDINIEFIILSALATLIILSIHEFSHAYIAHKLGDNTAMYMGRLTLNPLKHLDPFGAICMVFLHFGWAKPVPINPRNFRKPKRDFALTALAGPLSNLIMAFVSAFILLLTLALLEDVSFTNDYAFNIAQTTVDFIYIFHIINVGLAIFNLLPVPPLDGSRILNTVLPPKAYFKIMQYERIIYFVLIGWLFLGDIVSDALLSISFVAQNPIISAIAKILSLSDILSYLFTSVSKLMLDFWQLIPFLNVL
jgi:Zn-dependent protease